MAYLRAFRSQNVAVFVDAPPSRSSSSCSPSSNVAPDDISRRRIPLYAILEHDEETADSNCTRLSDEFSTALTLSVNDDDAASYRRRPSSSIPRMKRTRGSACLLDLVDHLGGGEGTLSSRSNVVGVYEPSSPVSSSSFSSRHDDYDHFFDLCLGGDDDNGSGISCRGDVRKMAKHHRGCIAFGRVPAARLHE